MQNHYYSGARRRSPGASFPRRNSSNFRNPGKTVHFSRYVNKAIEKADEVVYQPKHSFRDFALNPRTQDTLDYIGYKTPTEIQDQSISEILSGRDFIGLANTGTGKTAAFLLPAIEKLITNRIPVSILILAPTRELAGQIDEEFRRYSAGQNLYSTLVVGGVNINRQVQQVQRGPQLIIGTPGRIKDLINRRVLRLGNVSMFVLDEADRMCDMGFVNDIRSIESELSKKRQTLCFSATMGDDVRAIVREFTHDPITVSVVKGETNDHIDQDVIHVRDKAHKIEVLHELLAREEFEKVLIFGDTKHGVQRLADSLSNRDLPAVAIHGNKSQSQRDNALKSFKQGLVSIMVATDVAARGLDIPDVTHVINFDPPKAYDDYVHRIGRTGRAGKTGKALTFVN